MDILLFATLTCLVIVTVGNVINRYLQMPRMFTVVAFGIILSSFSLSKGVIESPEFNYLARMGKFFSLLLFGAIGFENLGIVAVTKDSIQSVD